MAPKVILNKIKTIDKRIRARYIDEIYDSFVPAYVDMVMEEYDAQLVARVTDRKSKTNPINYRDEFQTVLENYEYVTETSKSTIIHLPEVETFPWNIGRMRVIKTILEGIIGTYVEVDEEQYVAMFKKRPNLEPYDNSVGRKERIYLLRWTGTLDRLWREVFPGDAPVRYPFSNRPSIDIFLLPNKEVEDNILTWLPRFVFKASKEASK